MLEALFWLEVGVDGVDGLAFLGLVAATALELGLLVVPIEYN